MFWGFQRLCLLFRKKLFRSKLVRGVTKYNLPSFILKSDEPKVPYWPGKRPKSIKNSQNCVSRPIESLLHVQKIYIGIKTVEEHDKLSFDTIYIYIFENLGPLSSQKLSKKGQNCILRLLETLFVFRNDILKSKLMKYILSTDFTKFKLIID